MRWKWMLAIALAATVGCGDDEGTEEDDGGAGGSGGEAPTCGTFTMPTMVEVENLTPATGSTVPNQDIVHSFTIIDGASINVSDINFLLPGEQHTVGNVMGSAQFMTSTMGVDLEVTFSPFAWEIAPGDVHVIVQQRYQDPEGCQYALPTPLWSYAVTAN